MSDSTKELLAGWCSALIPHLEKLLREDPDRFGIGGGETESWPLLAEFVNKGRAILSVAQNADDPWQPIETAPKDGTHILLYRPGDSDCVSEGWWSESVTNEQFRWGGDGWWYQPTHWMPLPEPPKD